MNKNRNEKREVATEITEKQKIIRGYNKYAFFSSQILVAKDLDLELDCHTRDEARSEGRGHPRLIRYWDKFPSDHRVWCPRAMAILHQSPGGKL